MNLSSLRKKGLIPVAILLALIVAVYVAGLYGNVNYQMIQEQHAAWKNYAVEHPFYAAACFLAIYILSVMLIIPDSTLLTLLAGFLFPLPLAVLYATLAETIGATLFFLIIRQAFVDKKKKWIPHFFQKEDLILKNQANYLLFLRLSHLCPFWLINVLSGIYRVRITTFLWTTCVGILPLAILFAQTGEGLSTYVETHVEFKIREVFNTQIKVALIFLSCLPLIPVIYQKFIKK